MPTTGTRRAESPLQRQTLWQRLLEVNERFADKEALVAVDVDGHEHRVTYGEIVERARSLSAGLAGAGVRRGDRLTLWMTNLPEWVLSYFAALRIGAVVVPVNTWLKPAEIEYVIGHSRSRHVLLLDRFRKLDFEAMLAGLCPEWPESGAGRLHSAALPELRTVIVAHRDGSGDEREHCFDFQKLMAGGEDPDSLALADAMEAQVSPDDLALIKYTSGSTGFPKGAMLEQGGVVENGLRHTARLEVTEGSERWFSAMPFFHAGGSVWGLMTTLTRGSTLVFTEAFDPVLALQLIERERCTAVFGVPTMLRDMTTLLHGGGHDLSALRIISAPDPALVTELRGLIPSITTTINAFGLTEVYGPAAVTGPRDSIERQTTTCGTFFEGIEYRVVEPGTDRDVDPGVPGEVLLRGPVMRGYWDRPEETARAIDSEGWLHSEDLVAVDADGYVRYVGRIKAMLKVGGENVSVEEVENCILGHPAVLDCIVVGIPDPRKDQIGRAYVVCQPERMIEAEELRDWCSASLARFKVPAQFLFVPSLPRTGSGKVDRAAVQKLADAETQVAAGR
jgi:fatty-acyl-CoA synthase